MPPTHHPAAQALANFLIGDCSPGEALLIARHLDACLQCASRVHAMGAVGAAAGELTYAEPKTLHPGVELTPVTGASGLGEAVFRIRAAPGAAVPLDALAAAEVLILEGGFVRGGKTYGPGDFLSFNAKPPAPVSDALRGCTLLFTSYDD